MKRVDSPTLALAQMLIARASVTPDDQGIQELLAKRLTVNGFLCESMPAGPENSRVENLWALRPGTDRDAPVFVFAGHTDVVPSGPVEQWLSAPFTPSVRNGELYGRGAADMKTSIAAFIIASEELIARHRQIRGSIALLLTSDEEGAAVNGTVKVCEALQARGQRLDYCIVGEPSCANVFGDTIKNGRRGSLSGSLTVRGIQGHIAYPHLARNPIHQFAPALSELTTVEWDQGNAFFPPTSWQISNIHAGTGANNIIPGQVVVDFNFRFSPESSPESLQQRLEAILDKHQLEYDLRWALSGKPFLTNPGALVDAMQQAIRQHTGLLAELSTSGGISDARFIAQICPQVIEFGPLNASIHKVNEHTSVADMETLKHIYLDVLEQLIV